MKFFISAILTACIFGLTFSEPEKVTKSPQIDTNNSESEWLSDPDLNINWGINNPITSTKDNQGISLKDYINNIQL